jgi:steroid delta-isomerase-like uncharacterized protein
VLPYVTAYNAPEVPAAMARAARALGAQDPARALWELAERIGAPTSLAPVGFDPGRIPEAARLVVETPPTNPRPVDRAAVAELLRAAHAGTLPECPSLPPPDLRPRRARRNLLPACIGPGPQLVDHPNESQEPTMDHDAMLRLFRSHRAAEEARDFDAILATFVEDCYLDTVALGLRSQGRAAARAAYEAYFTAFPDLAPDDEGYAFSENTVVSWGTLRGTSGGDWLGIPPSGRSFAVRFVNVAPMRSELMEGESIYFDLATLCEQAGLPLDELRTAAKGRAQAMEAASDA